MQLRIVAGAIVGFLIFGVMPQRLSDHDQLIINTNRIENMQRTIEYLQTHGTQLDIDDQRTVELIQSLEHADHEDIAMIQKQIDNGIALIILQLLATVSALLGLLVKLWLINNRQATIYDKLHEISGREGDEDDRER